MNTRSWWNRHGSQLILLSLAIVTAWLVRQTQGEALFEIYYWVSRPFHQSDEQAVAVQQQATMLNAQIDELEAKIKDLESQNQNLQKLLGYVSSKPNDKGVVAPVIARNAEHWWQQITLGRGSKNGIKVDDLVMGPGGVVGRIVSVTPNTSQVLLLSDPTSRVGIAVSRTRQMGYLKGQGKNEGVMEFFENIPKVKPDDVVVTSAFSQIFPAGWPVGKVVSVDINKAPAPEAVIEFFVPLGSIEWVVVYPNPKAAQNQKESN
ncbi:MAG: rod shape-determining protein MreC [Cyanobacteriota bacterium]|nr:rod shape-determining protein MreC [Cyanobacteriota bacterium]